MTKVTWEKRYENKAFIVIKMLSLKKKIIKTINWCLTNKTPYSNRKSQQNDFNGSMDTTKK